MNRRRALLAALVLVTGPALGSPESFEPGVADRQVLEQAIAESRAATSPPSPGLSLYVSDAGITFSAWLAGVVDRLLPGFGRVADWFLAASWKLLVAVLAVLAVVFGFGLARRWWRERFRSTPSPEVVMSAAEAAAVQWPARHWEEEIRRLLAGDEVTAAVEALWWWLASVLVTAGVEPSWTSRELITHAGRGDLRPQIRRLDRMIYGRESPPVEDVRHLFRELREAA